MLGGSESQSPFQLTVTFTEETTFVFPASGTNNLTIDWGDDTTESVTTASPSHTYAAGTYQINATGTMTFFRFGNSSSAQYVDSLDSVGDGVLNTTSLFGFMYGCENMTYCNISGLDSSNINVLFLAFSECSSLVSLDVSGLNTSLVTNFGNAFSYDAALTDIIGLENLDVSSGLVFSNMLTGVTLPTSRYDAILNQNTGWASQTLQDGSLQSSDSMDFGNSTYTSTDADAVAGRAIIEGTYNWTITDGGSI
jgi:surface protein